MEKVKLAARRRAEAEASRLAFEEKEARQYDRWRNEAQARARMEATYALNRHKLNTQNHKTLNAQL